MTSQSLDKDAEQLHKMSQDLANFIALYEESDDKLKAQQTEMAQFLSGFQQELTEYIDKIDESLVEFKEVMTAAGAARWRVAAEQALKEGKQHADGLQQMVTKFQALSEKSLARLDRVAVDAEKRIAKTLSTLAIEQREILDGFKERAQEGYQQIDMVSGKTVLAIRRTRRFLNWDRFAIAIIAALLASWLIGLYINAEWPWESYQRAAQERAIGRTVLQAWPRLSKQDQEQLKKAVGLQDAKRG